MNARTDRGRATWANVFRGLSSRTLEDGEVLVTPGEGITRLFYLEEGRLRCAVVSESGCTKTLFYFRPGDLVGETHVFRRPVSTPLLITSVGRSVVRSLGLDEARRLVLMNPQLAEELLVSLAARTLAVIEQVREMRFLSVEARVAAFLDKMHRNEGEGGVREITLTHEEIADFVGAHRVTVTEALKRMEVAGAIETRRGRIAVKDLEQLRRVAAG